MKNLLIALIVAILMSVTVHADVAEVWNAFKANDFATCMSKADEVIADSKALDRDKAYSQRLKGHCEYKQGNYDKAKVEFQKVLHYSSSIKNCVLAQRYIGNCYYMQGKYAEAIPEYRKVLVYSTAIKDCASSLLHEGYCYTRLKQYTKANNSFLEVLIDFPEFTAVVIKVFDKVDFTSMSDEEVLTILKRIRRVTMVPVKDLSSEIVKVREAAEAKMMLLKIVGSQIANIEGK